MQDLNFQFTDDIDLESQEDMEYITQLLGDAIRNTLCSEEE